MINVDDAHARALAQLAAYVERSGIKTSELAAVARDLSTHYTEDRAIAQDAAASVAYLAYFGPRAIAAVCHAARVLPEIPHHVVDVGAGSGASALAWLCLGARKVTLIERSELSLARAKALLQGRPATFVAADLLSAAPTTADVVSAAFVFGELPQLPEQAYAALRRLAPNAAACVLVDAGDRPRARRLQTLRDQLVTAGEPIAGPCAHSDGCPALVRERDWCHDRIERQLPPVLDTVAQATGRDAAWMSVSWLVVAQQSQPPAIVIIGEPHKEKGRVRLPVCGAAGLRFIQAMKRHRAAHDALLDLPRGTHVTRPEVLADIEHHRRGDTAYLDHPLAAGTE